MVLSRLWYVADVVPVSIKLPRNLNKTRLGFVHGEEHGIEGIFGCLDLHAVFFE